MSSTRTLWSIAGLAVSAAVTLGTTAPVADGSAKGEGVNFSAAPCPPDEKAHHDRPHGDHHGKTTSHARVVIKQDNGDGQVFELKVNDGDIVVLRNGEEVEQKCVKTCPDGAIKILGDDGEELTTFELQKIGRAPAGVNVQKLWFGDDGQPGEIVIEGDADVAFGFTPQTNVRFGGNHPPVMLGIVLGEPGPALRHHLGLKDHDAILVEGVTEGLPADEAGIRTYDVIVSIDGSGEANGEILHEALSKKNPGDELGLIILRGCDKIRMTAELDAYDPSKLRAEAYQFGGAPNIEENVFKFRAAPGAVHGRPYVWSDKQGKILELLHDKLRGHMSEEQLEQTQKAIRDALEGVELDFEFGGPDLEGVGVMEFEWDGKSHKLVIPKGGHWRQLIEDELPRRLERKTEDAERRNEEIQRRLAERLERLSEEIERLRESLDDLD